MNRADRLLDDLHRDRMALFERPLERVYGIITRVAGPAALRASVVRCRRYLDGERDIPTADEVPSEIAGPWGRWREAGQHVIPPPPSALLPIPAVSEEVWTRARAEWRDEGSARVLLPASILRAVREEYGDATKEGRVPARVG